MPSTGVNIAPLDPADKRAPQPIKKLCIRCKQRKSTIVLQTATFCNECFQFNFEGKVHNSLEQSRLCTYLHRMEEEKKANETGEASVETQITQPLSNNLPSYPCNGRVAIGFSGGAASRTLLHIAILRLMRSKSEENGGSSKNGKLQEVHAIDVIYIDDSTVIEGKEDQTEKVRAIVQKEGGEDEGVFFRPIKLQNIFDDGETVECTAEHASLRFLSKTYKATESKQSSLLSLFQKIQPTDTPKGMLSNARSRSEDLLSIFTSNLLRREAIRLGASCLLTGETSTRMAVRVLESVGKGRGHKLPVELGSIRWNGLFILRPLKEVGAKDVALYARGKQLESLAPSDIVASQLLSSTNDGGNGDKASMARLTESLIHLLEKNVPSTVSTVNKVGDKLVFSNDSASHGYDDDNNDDFSKTSIAFHQVGPSVPLRLRRRQGSASTNLSQMTLNSSNGSVSYGGAGDRSLQGLGLGRRGSTLYFAAKKMIPYYGALACPLCQMPSQRGLHAWKRGLTISASKSTEEENPLKRKDQINLTELLCYACTMVLDTPETTKEGTKMCLPSFVLSEAMLRLAGDASLSEEDAATARALLNGKSTDDQSEQKERQEIEHEEKPILHKLDREQMKKHLSGFLLDDEEGQNSATTQSRQRKQTDW